MAKTDRFMIAPLDGGLQADLKPWIIPDKAFAEMNNAYPFRGRIRKRFGSRYMNTLASPAVAQLSSRFRLEVATTSSGSASGTVPGAIFQPGQLFSVGSQIFTVYQTGTPADMLATGVGSGTYDTSNGDFSISGTGLPDNTPVYWYPAQPVMGLITYQTATSNVDPTFGFDTQFSYTYSNGAWTSLGPLPPASNSAIWTGSNYDFFWGTTWRGTPVTSNLPLLFVVNNNPSDGIYYWNGNTSVWTNFTPTIDETGTILFTSLMMIPFRGYLVAINTWEGMSAGAAVNYNARARWSSYNDAITPSTSWLSIPGSGSAIDAATMESAISCEFIKDQLVVYFERSTWSLVFTGNHVQPFTWQQLNTELGVESSFSIVPFDQAVLGIANIGIHSCNGVNVQRIDDLIPDEVWNIYSGTTGSEVSRVYGIRDFFVEQVYWTFPNADHDPANTVYPNKVLVYNYKLGTWGLNDDSITCFGYFYETNASAVSWSSTDIFWSDDEIIWGSGDEQQLNQTVLAGNQEGYVFIIDASLSTNASVLQITNLTLVNGAVTLSIIDHNLEVEEWIFLTNLNGLTGPFIGLYQIYSVIDANTIVIIAPDINAVLKTGQVYTGGGTVARVSRLSLKTKQFNFYVKDGYNTAINKVDFLVDRTANGEFTVDYYASTGFIPLAIAGNDATGTGALLGTAIVETSPYELYPFEQQQDRLWHPSYLQAEGEAIQMHIYLTDMQMAQYEIATAPFQLHAITIYAQRTSSRLQ